jgi:hypothetical protein
LEEFIDYRVLASPVTLRFILFGLRPTLLAAVPKLLPGPLDDEVPPFAIIARLLF